MTRTFTLLISAALVVTASACTANAAPSDSSVATVETSTVESSSPPAATSEPSAQPTTASDTPGAATTTADGTPTAAATEGSTSSQAPASQSPVDGFGLSGQDLADARAAWDAYQAFRTFSAQSMTDPGADWSAQIASLMGTPADQKFQKSLSDYAKLQITVDDKTRAEIIKIDVKPDFIVFSACIDATETKSFDKYGKDVTAPDAPGSYKRHPGELWMERQDGVWRFVDSNSDFQKQC